MPSVLCPPFPSALLFPVNHQFHAQAPSLLLSQHSPERQTLVCILSGQGGASTSISPGLMCMRAHQTFLLCFQSIDGSIHSQQKGLRVAVVHKALQETGLWMPQYARPLLWAAYPQGHLGQHAKKIEPKHHKPTQANFGECLPISCGSIQRVDPQQL